MPENQISNSKDQEPKMITLTVEVFEPFYNFLKEYLAFFGSKTTMEDLAQQMIYNESRRLHVDLTKYSEGEHYIGRTAWFKKFKHVAITTEGWSFETETLPSEEKQDAVGGEKHE